MSGFNKKEYMKKYNREHREKYREYNKKNYYDNAISRKKYAKEYRDSHVIERRLNKAFRKSIGVWNRGNRTAQTRRWLVTHRKQKCAHGYIERALKKGTLIKPERCENCNTKTAYLEAHHDDYSKPLEVRWLCRKKCHQLI